jgi:hypothetical protein
MAMPGDQIAQHRAQADALEERHHEHARRE